VTDDSGLLYYTSHMSGHNKWSKIKHKKAATDAKRSKEFSKLAKLIIVESKKVGGDTSSATLRAAIEKAKKANMPKDNIDRAVQKGKTDTGALMEVVLYEAYGPGGVAIIMEGLTDNRNRTAAEIKHILSKNGLTLAEPGAALWAFEKTGDGYNPKTTTEISEEDGEKLMSVVEALEESDNIQEVYTNAS